MGYFQLECQLLRTQNLAMAETLAGFTAADGGPNFVTVKHQKQDPILCHSQLLFDRECTFSNFQRKHQQWLSNLKHNDYERVKAHCVVVELPFLHSLELIILCGLLKKRQYCKFLI